jgi:DNA-binding transcriptional LysR family regulator
MDIPTDFLRTFITLSDCRSFSLASGKLHRSQSATSTQIAKLEERAGLKLVDRSQRPLKLTEAGEVFLQYAKEIISKTDSLAESLRQLSAGNGGEVKIGATRSVGAYLMPRIVQSILKQFPGLKILLLTQPRTPTYELLQQGRIDFAVVLSDCRPNGFKVVALKREPLCLVTFSKHRLAKTKVIQAKQIDKIPFIAGVKSNGHSEMIDQICERSGLPQYSAAFQISTLQGRKEAAKAGLGVTVLPRFVVQTEVKNKSLTQLRIKGIRLASAAIMLIEPTRMTPRANVELVKKLVEENIRKMN